MSSITKQVLVLLVIYIFHVHHAFEIEPWAQFYNDKLGLSYTEIRKLEKYFTDQFHEVGEEFTNKFGKLDKGCDHLIVHANKYFIKFTESSEEALLKICNVKSKLRKLLKMNPNCPSNLREYLKDYLYKLFFDQITICLNKKTIEPSVEENSDSKSVRSNELDSQSVRSDELDSRNVMSEDLDSTF
ncbi:uncharacterized protein LOC122505919 [Leptopilina heterotoma]|uniref:uncharacterized protein LOC122505919 n=1 Tax=Leptopilina heterotoma TaxID=63436 RepID=UPI001CA8DC39|nr:uncharacterized protein LOC122505919 [Leptopilina heterotoma]